MGSSRLTREGSAKTTGLQRKGQLESPPKRHKPAPQPGPRHQQEDDDIVIELDDVYADGMPSPDENQAANAGKNQTRIQMAHHAAGIGV